MPLKAEQMLDKVKAQLRAKHPKWDSDKINSTAYAIVVSYYQNKGQKSPFNR